MVAKYYWILLLITLPILTGALTMSLADLHYHAVFFNPINRNILNSMSRRPNLSLISHIPNDNSLIKERPD